MLSLLQVWFSSWRNGVGSCKLHFDDDTLVILASLRTRIFQKGGTWRQRSYLPFSFAYLLPNGVVTIAFGVSFYLTKLSARAYEVQIANGRSWAVVGSLHIGVGVFSVVMTASIICWLEKDVRGAIVILVKQKRV